MNDRQRKARREMQYDEETGCGRLLVDGKWHLFMEWDPTGDVRDVPPWDDEDFWGV